MTSILSLAELPAACEILRAGGVLAYPTESVFGLGADPHNAAAVARVFALKRRDPAVGCLLIASMFEQVEGFIDQSAIDPERLATIRCSWPGPETWIVPRSEAAPPWVVGGHAGIALRVTAHRPAALLCEAFGGALLSTSANLHGQPPARSTSEVLSSFDGAIDGLLDARVGASALPTRIRDGVTGQIVRA